MLSALIVEDDPPSLSALAELVEGYGFQVRTAATLNDARVCIRAHTPDVVLVDRRLPDGDGLCLLEELPENACTDVVVISGDTELTVPSHTAGLHTLCRLDKPVDVDRLKHLLADIARRSS